MKPVPYASNQGVRIHYKVEGDGPSLLLLHGGLNNLKMWYELDYVEPLKKDYQLILMDVRGYGMSDKPHSQEAYELELLVDDILTVLNDLNVSRAHFLGYSMSGRIGFGAAKYAPERFRSFIIGGAHPYLLDHKEFDADVQALRKGMGAVIAEIEKATGTKMPPERRARLMANDTEAIVALFSASHWRLSLEDALPNMTMPCLVFAGEADTLYLGAKKCVENLQNASFISMPGVAHFGVLSQTNVLLPHITKFLEKASAYEG